MKPTKRAADNYYHSGINVYLQQKSAVFRFAPDWFHRLFASRKLLDLAAGNAASTQPGDVGELTISMLKGETGNQARELQELIGWLKTHRPDVVSLSNALLVGMAARQIKRELKVPVICSLQGEDIFLNAMPDGLRERAWATAAERAADVDLFIAPSHYFADFMRERLRLPENKIRVVSNGINLDGYSRAKSPHQNQPVTLGFFARMCREKCSHNLVDAFIELKQRGTVPKIRLKIGGSCSPSDQKVVDEQKDKLRKAGLESAVEFHPNLSRDQKLEFLHSLTLFSCVPAMHGRSIRTISNRSLGRWRTSYPTPPRRVPGVNRTNRRWNSLRRNPTRHVGGRHPITRTRSKQSAPLKGKRPSRRDRKVPSQTFGLQNIADICAEVTRVSLVNRKS